MLFVLVRLVIVVMSGIGFMIDVRVFVGNLLVKLFILVVCVLIVILVLFVLILVVLSVRNCVCLDRLLMCVFVGMWIWVRVGVLVVKCSVVVVGLVCRCFVL